MMSFVGKSHFVLAATVVLVLGYSAMAAQPEMRPNILFIMTDQQHAGMMSCTGNKWLSTPALDGLASEGVRFEKAYVANPVCVPSRMSIMTGTMPGRFGVFSNGQKATLSNEVIQNSLGMVMHRAGYDTFYGGKVHLDPRLSPKNAGYDVVHRDSRADLPAACIEFIKQKRDRPFFAVASFINPHDICYAHQAKVGGDKQKLAASLYRRALALPLEQLPPLPPNFEVPSGEPGAIEPHMNPRAVTPAGTMRNTYSEKDWRIYRWIYCRFTEQVDRHIGQILDAVKEAGLEERTLILFTSDHGNMDASHRLASKGFFYEESVRVPFLLKYPGILPAGKVDTENLVAVGLDILPTFGDYADVVTPKHLHGRSLRPLIEGKKRKPDKERREYVVAENSSGRMIRSHQFKYCVYDADTDCESLVDLKNDPGEMKNLATLPEYRNILLEHRRYLRTWVEKSSDTEGKAFVVNTAMSSQPFESTETNFQNHPLSNGKDRKRK